MMMLNCHISPFKHASHYNHDPMRPRKLLMHKREIKKWGQALEQKGYTIIPLSLYFKSGKVKVEIGKPLINRGRQRPELDSWSRWGLSQR